MSPLKDLGAEALAVSAWGPVDLGAAAEDYLGGVGRLRICWRESVID